MTCRAALEKADMGVDWYRLAGGIYGSFTTVVAAGGRVPLSGHGHTGQW